MPMPKPKKEEKKDDFVGRCMSELKEEFTDKDQRLAVCFSQWREKEKDSQSAMPKPNKDETKQEWMKRCTSDKEMKEKYPDSEDCKMACEMKWNDMMMEKGSNNSYYSIRAKADSDFAEVLLYGDIGDSFFAEGTGAKQFVDDLKALGKIKNLDIRINSGGGSVFEGLAIFNAIERHSSKKTVYIDGLAASIASVIAMAGDKIQIADNAMLMIHNPFGMVMGNADDMRAMASSLDKIKEGMITSYQKKSKLPTNEISSLMSDETWMTAKEALKMGFVDEIGKSMKMAASFDLSRYKKAPNFLNRNILSKEEQNVKEPVTLQSDSADKTIRVLTGLQSNPTATDSNPVAILSDKNNSQPMFVSPEIHLIAPERLDAIKKKIYGGK